MSGDAAREWRCAEAEREAALAILSDRRGRERLAVEHLRLAWSLCGRVGAEGVEEELGRLDGGEHTRDELFASARRLDAALRAVDRTQLDASERTRVIRQWLARAATAVVAIALTLGVYTLTRRDGSGPWRGEYYDNADLEGAPTTVRRAERLNFGWGRRRPLPELPWDRFSIRWDTCLVLEQPFEVRFEVVANDGMRMFVDGQEIIESWKKGRTRSRSAEVDLGRGVHHLRVEYFEFKGSASLSLRAAFDDDEDAVLLQGDLLRFPDAEGRDPCRGVRKRMAR